MDDFYKAPSSITHLMAIHKPSFSGPCPHCGQQALFDAMAPVDAIGVIRKRVPPHSSQAIMGDAPILKTNLFAMRRCPAPDCQGIIFLVAQEDTPKREGYSVIRMFPEREISIDTEGYPEMIASLYREATQCYGAACYRAAGVMIRRVLEEICKEFGAQGRSLHYQLQDLPNKVNLIPGHYDALMDLKLLGNDSAHLELSDFDQIDEEEIDIALELVQEILRTWYRHQHLSAKLARRKKNRPAT